MTYDSEDFRSYLTVGLAVAFFLSLIGVGYLALTPQATTDPYTEFYILGPSGNASGYPTNLSVGETGSLIIGVVNHEHRQTTYTIALSIEDRELTSRTVTVANGEEWEGRFSVTPDTAGRQRLWVRLYRGSSVGTPSDPYRELWLWINVSG